MADKNPLASRIDLKAFITTLMGLWEEGFDAIDLEFVPEEQGAYVKIIVKEDYLGKEDPPKNKEQKRPLNDDDLEKLL